MSGQYLGGEGIGEDLREEQAREGQHGEGRERPSCLRGARNARSRAAGRGRRRHRHPRLGLLQSAGDPPPLPPVLTGHVSSLLPY